MYVRVRMRIFFLKITLALLVDQQSQKRILTTKKQQKKSSDPF